MKDTTTTILGIAVASNTPVILWGEPGIGKTAMIQALARAMNLPLVTIIASIHEPSDFAGLPVPQGDRITYLPPAWAVELAQAREGILFFDEITTAPPAVQAALLRVVLERVVGHFTMPPTIRMIAAANPPEVAVSGYDLPAPLANRFVHLDWEPLPTEEWTSSLLQGFPEPELRLPKNWEAYLPQAKGLIATFLRSRPDLLHQRPEDPGRAGRAWPSPRTWEMASKMLAGALAIDPQDEGLVALAVGAAVGQGVGVELAALVAGDLLPNPWEALDHPDRVPLPNRPDKLLAFLGSIAATVCSADPETQKILWPKAWRIMGRAGQEGPVDVVWYAARPLRDLFKRRLGELPTTPILEELRPFAQLHKELQKALDL